MPLHAGGAVSHPIIRNTISEFGRRLKTRKPHPDDAVFWRAQQVLDRWQHSFEPTQSFEHYADPFCLQALTARPAQYHTQCYDSTGVYLLKRDKLFIKLRLRVVFCNLADPFDGQVQVQVGDCLEPFEEWLNKMPSSTVSWFGDLGYKVQHDWARNTAQVFPFQSLPFELQDQILLQAIGKRVALRRTSGNSSVSGPHQPTGPWLPCNEGHCYQDEAQPHSEADTTIPHVPPIQAASLRLNQATRERALRVLQRDTVQVMTEFHGGLNCDYTWIPRNPASLFGSSLRKFEIAWTSSEYLDFFRVQVAPLVDIGDLTSLHPDNRPPLASILKGLSNLQELSITFRSTAYAGNSPWWHYQEQDNDEDNKWASVMDMDRHPCQKTLVEWIMVYAFQHICHIPKVHLIGYLKTETKDKWQRMLYNAYMHDVSYCDYVKSEKEKILSLPFDEVPPVCRCPRACGDWTSWNLEGAVNYNYHDELPGCDGYHATPNGCAGSICSLPAFKDVYRKYYFDFDDADEPSNPDFVVGLTKVVDIG